MTIVVALMVSSLDSNHLLYAYPKPAASSPQENCKVAVPFDVRPDIIHNATVPCRHHSASAPSVCRCVTPSRSPTAPATVQENLLVELLRGRLDAATAKGRRCRTTA